MEQNSIRHLFEAYIRDLERRGKRSWSVARHMLLGTPRTAANTKTSLVAGAAQDLGEDRSPRDITPADIRQHLASVYRRGAIVKARDARAYLHSAFAYGQRCANDYTSDVGLVDWGIAQNPVSAVPIDLSERANCVGSRNLSEAEVRDLWCWLDSETKSSFAPALKLMIATGQRVTEILGLKYEMYDDAMATVEWPMTKNGKPHTIPLPKQAADTIDELGPPKAAFFFPHASDPTRSATVAGIEKLVRRYLAKGDRRHFTPRDIRRTWKTLTGAAGLSRDIRDRIQNHKRSDVGTRHYDRYDYLREKRAAMGAWSIYLEGILTNEERFCGNIAIANQMAERAVRI